jgi:hypothetical protein
MYVTNSPELRTRAPRPQTAAGTRQLSTSMHETYRFNTIRLAWVLSRVCGCASPPPAPTHILDFQHVRKCVNSTAH